MPLPLPKSRDEISKIQSVRKKIAFKKAQKSKFHQARLKHVDEDNLDDPDEWRKIPILTKDELRTINPDNFFSEFCHGSMREVAELWRSGGSTGIPLFYPRTFEDLPYCILSFARNFIAPGLTNKDTAHISFPLGIHPVGHVYARACQNEGIGVNWAGSGSSTPSALQIDLLHRLKPTVWMGMSSYGIHLANLADEIGVDLANGSVKTILCSAEAISNSKRAKIKRLWNAEIWDGFGMTEAGMMGGESEAHDGFHIWTDMFAIEVVDTKTSEPVKEGAEGSLVVTPLFTNNCTPFIRWNSGDIVTYSEFGATDGPLSVFPVIRHSHRTVGFFKVRGININHQELEDFLFDYHELVDFKAELITENDLDTLLISLEVFEKVDTQAVTQRIADNIKTTFGLSAKVNLLRRGTIAGEFESSLKAPRFSDKRE